MKLKVMNSTRWLLDKQNKRKARMLYWLWLMKNSNIPLI